MSADTSSYPPSMVPITNGFAVCVASDPASELHVRGRGRSNDGAADLAADATVLGPPRARFPSPGGARRAVRTLMTEKRIDVPGFGVLPCVGCYAEVVQGGIVRVDDGVTLR